MAEVEASRLANSPEGSEFFLWKEPQEKTLEAHSSCVESVVILTSG